MRGWVIGILLGLGLLLILVAAGNGRDNTGETVRTQAWADDVCRTVGAWEGSLKDIRKELQKSNYGARNSDGSTGDTLENTVSVRLAVDKAIIATKQTLRHGLQRAGAPDSPQGAKAAAAMRAWALQTEANLLVARQQLKHDPPKSSIASQAFELLSAPVTALARSAVQGRATVKAVAALDPALGDAFQRSGTCRRLQRRTA
jgi:hypothetical protein